MPFELTTFEHPLLAAQASMNRSTRGQWEMFASHRRQLERLIVPAQPGRRACVLGAGNCNDLDLRWMTEVFREVHLVDLDAAALSAGVRRQRCEPSSRLQLHAPVDLTGIAGAASGGKSRPPGDQELEDALARLRAPPTADDLKRVGWAPEPWPAEEQERAARDRTSGGFDLVLSPCLLSQLLVSVRDVIGSDHPLYPQLRDALRARHLRMIIDLLSSGGTGALAIDLASTENYADLPRVPEDQLEDLLRTLVADGKCFRALTPGVMRAALAREGRSIEQICFTRPWLWHLGLRKSFLVYGLTFRKRPVLQHDRSV